MIQPTERLMQCGRAAGALSRGGGAAHAARWLFACGLLGLAGTALGQPADLTLSNTNITSGSTSYAATHSITAGPAFTVSGSAAVSFTAGSYIVLGDGFRATAGSAGLTFQAGIGTVAVPPAPTLTSVNPPSGVQGASVGVTLTGSNFVSGGTTVSGSTGITVSNVTVVSASQITATLTIAPAAPTGPGTVTVTTGGGSATASFTVNAASQTSGDFTLLISPSNQTVPVGGQGVPYTVTVASTSGYTGEVYLTLASVSSPCIWIPYFPDGANPVGVAAPFSVSVLCGAGTVASFTVQGNLGNVVRHSVSATISIGPAQSIAITSSAPSMPSVPAPGSVSYTVQVSPVNGFTGTVRLSASGLPTGTSGPSTGSFAPASLTFSGSNAPQTATFTINTAAGSAPGPYSITIVGASSNVGNYATVPLVISGTPQPTDLDRMAVLSMLVLRHEALAGPNAPTDSGGLYGLPPADAATVNAAVDAASQQLNQLAAQAPSFTDGTANMNAQNAILLGLNQQLHTQIAASSAQVMDAYMNGFISPQLARYTLDSASGTAQAASSCGYISQMYQNDCLEMWNEINFYIGSSSGLGRLVLSTVHGPDQSSFCAYVKNISETYATGDTATRSNQKLCWNFVDPSNPAVARAAAWMDTEDSPVRGTYALEAFHKFELYRANPNPRGSPILTWAIPSPTASFDNLNPLPTPRAPTNATWTIGSDGDDKYTVDVDLRFTVSGVLNPDGTPRLISDTQPVTTVTVPDCSAIVTAVLSPLPTGNAAPTVTWSGGGTKLTNLTSGFNPQTCALGKSTTFTAAVGHGNSLKASVKVVVQAPAPDFTVSGPSSPVAFAAGGSAAYTVTVTPVNGFTSTVNLALAAGLPQFASASVSPASLTFASNQAQQATVTVSTMACTPPGTATVTAASGSLSHSSSAALAVTNSGLPVVCGMTPMSGGAGTLVTLSGLNFGATAAAISVSFGGVAATGVSVNSSGNSIQAKVPAGLAVGGPPIQVTVGVNGVLALWNGASPSFAVAAGPANGVKLVVTDDKNNPVPQVTIHWPAPGPGNTTPNPNGETYWTAPTTTGGGALSSAGCLNITPDPSMPQLTAALQNSDGSLVSGEVTWGLTVAFPMNTYKPPTQSAAAQWIQTPLNASYPGVCYNLYTGPPWPGPLPNPFPTGATFSPDWCLGYYTGQQYFSGGQGTVTATYNGQTLSYNFCILGKNPDPVTASSWLTTNRPFWFENNVAVHETQLSQFCDNTSRTLVGGYCKTTPVSTAGLPVWGFPTGYGILQIDPPPNMNSIWSWKANSAAWEAKWAQPFDPNYASPSDNNPAAYAFWVRQAYQWAVYINDQCGVICDKQPTEDHDPGPGPFSPTQQPFNPSPLPAMPVSFVSNVNLATFLSEQYDGPNPNQYWYGDAVLMKQLAGTQDSCGTNANYVSWKHSTPNVSPTWSFHKASTYNADIVYEFSTCSTLQSCVKHTMGPCNQ